MKSDNVHEVFSYPVERSTNEPSYLIDYLGYYDKVMPLLRLSSLASPFIKTGYSSCDKNFAFLTTKYSLIIEGLDSNTILLFGKPQEFPFAVRNNISFYPVYDFLPELLSLFKDDPQLASSRAIKLIDKVVESLMYLNPAYQVFWNDSLFLERFLIFCGRRAGVRSICIQHGLFHDTFDCKFLDGYYADYMFVWSKSQAELYCDPEFDKDKLRVMGYPYKVENLAGTANNKRICLLGENIETTNKDLGLRKKHVYEEIAKLLSRDEFELVYKLHPFEKDSKYIPANVKKVNISLRRAFEEYEIFIALSTTALLEATLHGKVAIQYLDTAINGTDFQEKGYSYSTRKMDDIPVLVQELSEPLRVPESVILIPDDPSSKFLEVVGEL